MRSPDPIRPTLDPPAGAACVANIGARERRQRLTFGVLASAVALAGLAAEIALGAGRWWRAPLGLLAYGGATGWYQWRDQTCVALAARDARSFGGTVEPIRDPAELARVHLQARGVRRKAAIAALAFTVVALLLPRG